MRSPQNLHLLLINCGFAGKSNAEVRLSAIYRLTQAYNLPINKINMVRLGVFWQAGHADYITGNGNNHFGTGVQHNITNLQIKAFDSTILLCVCTERELRLCNTYRELCKAILLGKFYAVECRLRKSDRSSTVDILGNLFYFLLYAILIVVCKLEFL